MNQNQYNYQPGPVMMQSPEASWIGQTTSIVVMWPNCQRCAQTRVKCSVGTKLWMCWMIWTLPILFGLPPWCWFPFLIPSCYEYKHYWSWWDTYLGASMTGSSMGFLIKLISLQFYLICNRFSIIVYLA